MSSTAHAIPTIVKPEALRSEKLPLLQTGLILAWLPCLLAAVIGMIFLREQFAFSWLWAFVFAFTVSSGCFFWTLVHFATDAAWSTVIRRQWENVACLMRWMWIPFIPLVICAKDLWSWLSVPETDALLAEKIWYLTPEFTLARSVIVLVLFALVTFRMRQLSVRQDHDGDAKWTFKLRWWSYIGLPLFGVGFSAVMVDWLMALDYKWFSTMWGVYLFAGAAWSGMALAIIMITLLRRTGHMQQTVSMEHYHVMGKLLFAFTVFWAYIAFSQYMLIWYANIPEETTYFLRRNTEGWHLMSTLLMLGHFVVPFLLLLAHNLPVLPVISKRNSNYMLIMAVYVLVIQALDLYIIIMPVRPGAGPNPALGWIWLDLACLGTILLPLVFIYLRDLSRLPLFPARDPRVVESIQLHN